jgi:hypothetical protein
LEGHGRVVGLAAYARGGWQPISSPSFCIAIHAL